MTCSVTGTLVDPTGAALPDTPYRLARAGGIVGTGAGTVVPKIITGVSGTAAEFDEDLVAGNYLLTVYPATGQTYSVALPVPDEASAALSDLVTGVDAPQVAVWLTEARAAAAAAETAASAAEASAAAIQPYDSRADAIAALPDLADTITRVSWREGNAILSSVRQTGATEFAAGWAMARRENTFSLGDYLHEDDLSAALAGDLAGQDIDRVTAAVQAFHHAVFAYCLSPAADRDRHHHRRRGSLSVRRPVLDFPGALRAGQYQWRPHRRNRRRHRRDRGDAAIPRRAGIVRQYLRQGDRVDHRQECLPGGRGAVVCILTGATRS